MLMVATPWEWEKGGKKINSCDVGSLFWRVVIQAVSKSQHYRFDVGAVRKTQMRTEGSPSQYFFPFS
jgi:hypothetical protein